MSGAGVKLGGLALVIAAVFGGAYGLGKLVGPVSAEPKAAAEHDGMAGGHSESAPASGATLEVLSTGLLTGQQADFTGAATGEHGHG